MTGRDSVTISRIRRAATCLLKIPTSCSVAMVTREVGDGRKLVGECVA